MLLALGLERLPLQRLRPLLVPVYALTVISLVAVRVIGTTALGAQRWISIGGFMFSHRSSQRSRRSCSWQQSCRDTRWNDRLI